MNHSIELFITSIPLDFSQIYNPEDYKLIFR
jgi:hypothetical protein